MTRRLPLALALAAAAAVAVPAAGPAQAAAAGCGTPAVKSIDFETPEVVVARAKRTRVRGGGWERSVVACHRPTGRRTYLTSEYDVPGEEGDGSVAGFFGRRTIVLDEGGSGAESESRGIRLVDVVTGRSTERAITDDTDSGGQAIVGPGAMASLYGSSGSHLELHVPGRRTAQDLGDGTGLSALAMGARTLYWRAADDVVKTAPLPVLPSGPAATPRREPARATGPCEARGSRTLLRHFSLRVYRAGDGAEVACRGRRRWALTAAVPGTSAAGPVRDVEMFADDLVSYRYAVDGGRTALVVFDAKRVEVLHATVVAGDPADVRFAEAGIAVALADGLRIVRGSTITEVEASAGAADAAFAFGAGGRPFVFWTSPEGPRSAPLGPPV